MKTPWALAFGGLFGLLAAGLIFLAARPPHGQPVRLLPPPTPLPLIVHVSGEVVRPGVCRLSPGSRVEDALEAAGGLTGNADVRAINLAAFVQDGELIRVPLAASNEPVSSSAVPVRAEAVGDGQIIVESAGFPINLNTASQEELESLPGIGPVTAEKILAYRQAHGDFATIEAIEDVPGIGPKTFERIKALITIGAVP